MRFNLVLDLPDVPGQLLEVLEPMGRLGANIVAVIHQRDVKTERGTVPVQITIEGDKETLDMVMEADFGHKKKILKSIKEVGDQKGFLVINEV